VNKGWTQFLLVAVPVLSLVGTWLALKTLPGKREQKDNRDNEDDT